MRTVAELEAKLAKAEDALLDCQHLFQNIRDYGAMGSPSDYVKVQEVWAKVNAVLADTTNDEAQQRQMLTSCRTCAHKNNDWESPTCHECEGQNYLSAGGHP